MQTDRSSKTLAAYAAHGRTLHGYCMRLARNPHDAEDLVQDAFVALLTRVEHLDAGTTDLGPYLRVVARNVHTRRQQRARRVVLEETLDDASDRTDTANAALDNIELRRIGTAAKRLPERQRAALALAAVDGASVGAIGDELGINANATSQLLFRARAGLRRELTAVPAAG